MEESSPLAAIHRPRFAQPWAKKDLFINLGSGASGFHFREKIHRPEYLGINNVRGSSPAASLAADLSQNFRLDSDASPRFATPRRNLFSAAALIAAEAREYITTPELASSSPVAMEGMLQDSPIPKSAAHCSDEMMSPTPFPDVAEVSDVSDVQNDDDDDDNASHGINEDYDEMMMDSPVPVSRKSSLEGLKFPNLERRAPRRPSITRLKGYTTSTVQCRAAKAELPYFRFGDASRLSHVSSASSLTEPYEFQAPYEKRPQTANSSAPGVPPHLRCRPAMQPFGSASRSGSPINGHARRTSNPFLRSRKTIRRSFSMFEHPEDIMKPNTETTTGPLPKPLEAVMDIEEPQEPLLPHFSSDDPGDSIPRITKDTLVDVLDGKYSGQYDQKLIIDCRFEYEYEGGHIDGAVNYNDKELLAAHLFNTPMDGRTLIILHCEYSAHRAPLMARHIRSQDRTINAEHYPKLTYPDVYILSGGYSEFFLTHQCRCYPQNYVEMSDEKHQRTCERELGRLKKTRRQPTLGRAKTFAFETSTAKNCSPFPKHRSVDDFSLGSPSDGAARGRVVTL